MKVLTTIGKGAGVLLPILLVVSVGIDLYDRFSGRVKKSTPTTTTQDDAPEETAPETTT